MEFRETSQKFQLNQITDKKNNNCLNELNELKFQFQTDAESFSFLSWKTKKFYS